MFKKKIKKSQSKISIIPILTILSLFALSFFVFAGPGDPSEDWEINGDTVTNTNQTYAIISAYPHTISSSGYVYFNITSKVYTGDVDAVWGFDTDSVKPKNIEVYKPHTVYWNTTESLTIRNVTGVYITSEDCEVGNEYNQIKRNATYIICTQYDGEHNCLNNKEISSIFCFDSYSNVGNVYTLNWINRNERVEDWLDFTSSLESLDYSFDGMTKFWYIKNVPIVQGQSYLVRGLVEVPVSLEPINGKYSFGIKRSSDTIHEAISTDTFYYLDPWYSSSWKYAKNLTINKSYFVDSQTNFPILVNITDSNLSTYALANGNDILFTNSSGTKLDHEIEFWNKTSGRLVAWVKLGTISNTTNTIITMYFNNSGASNQQNAKGVWSNGYLAVYHMNDLNTTVTKDSLGVWNLTKEAVNNPSEIEAQIKYGQNFVRTDTLTSKTGMQTPTAITLESWWKVDDYDSGYNRNQIVSICSGTTDDIGIGQQGTTGYAYNFFHNGGSWTILAGTSNQGTTNKNYNAYVVDPSNSRQQTYVNGKSENSGVVSTAINYGGTEYILVGKNPGDNNADHDGLVDEVRISNVSRSTNFINASYQTMAFPNQVVIVGSLESGTPPVSTCTYSSGNWLVNCADNCTISSNVNLGGNNLSVTGTGYFQLEANVTNYEQLLFSGTDSSNICEIRGYNGWFQKVGF